MPLQPAEDVYDPALYLYQTPGNGVTGRAETLRGRHRWRHELRSGSRDGSVVVHVTPIAAQHSGPAPGARPGAPLTGN